MSSSSFNPRGAVDLSQLAEQAKQRAASGPGGSPGAKAGGSYVVEVTEQTFEAQVIRPSLQHPVVVEFYSPRVSSGQQLSDALAAAASEAGGKYLIARLNVDAAPQLAQQLGLQAVPTVVGVVGGQLVPLFQGVIPADQVRAALDQLVKAAVANGIVGRAEPVGGPVDDGAEDEPDPRFAAADAALERGDFAAAVEEFDKLLAANPADAEAKAGKAQAGLLARTANTSADVVLAAAAAPDADLQVHLDAADLEVVGGQVDEAFARLIDQVKRRSGDERDQARLRLLELFETIGNTDPRVQKARRNLMAALF